MFCPTNSPKTQSFPSTTPGYWEKTANSHISEAGTCKCFSFLIDEWIKWFILLKWPNLLRISAPNVILWYEKRTENANYQLPSQIFLIYKTSSPFDFDLLYFNFLNMGLFFGTRTGTGLGAREVIWRQAGKMNTFTSSSSYTLISFPVLLVTCPGRNVHTSLWQ